MSEKSNIIFTLYKVKHANYIQLDDGMINHIAIYMYTNVHRIQISSVCDYESYKGQMLFDIVN